MLKEIFMKKNISIMELENCVSHLSSARVSQYVNKLNIN